MKAKVHRSLRSRGLRLEVVLCGLALAGCALAQRYDASGVPQAAQVPARASLSLAVLPLADAREEIVRERLSGSTTLSAWRTETALSDDIFSGQVTGWVSEAVAAHLGQSRLFARVELVTPPADLSAAQVPAWLRTKGYDLCLAGEVRHFTASKRLSVPEQMAEQFVASQGTVFSFGLPVALGFNLWDAVTMAKYPGRAAVEIADLQLTDLRTGQAVWSGRAAAETSQMVPYYRSKELYLLEVATNTLREALDGLVRDLEAAPGGAFTPAPPAPAASQVVPGAGRGSLALAVLPFADARSRPGFPTAKKRDTPPPDGSPASAYDDTWPPPAGMGLAVQMQRVGGEGADGGGETKSLPDSVFGDRVGAWVAEATAAHLGQAQLFARAEYAAPPAGLDSTQVPPWLRGQGYDLALEGRVRKFNAFKKTSGLEHSIDLATIGLGTGVSFPPMLVFTVAAAPVALGFLATDSVTGAAYPAEAAVEIADLRLTDLRTGQVVWSGHAAAQVSRMFPYTRLFQAGLLDMLLQALSGAAQGLVRDLEAAPALR